MKRSLRIAVVSFALANLYLLSLIGPLVSPQHELVFHLPGSATALFVPVLLDVVIVFVALTAALLLARRNARLSLLLSSALVCSLPSGLLTTLYGFANRRVPLWLGWPVAALCAVAFLAINLRHHTFLRGFRRVRRVLIVGLTFLALPELLMFVQLAWYGWQARHLNPPFRPVPVTAAVTPETPRVLWLLLDELSFDQVYGHRYAGLQLPHFDQLAQEAVIFTQARPAAEYTRIAMPAMLTGIALRQTQPSADGQRLRLYPASRTQSLLFSAEDTVFGDAHRAGLPTSVAGWYEPYCRLLQGVLNRCTWTYSDELPGGLTTAGTLWQHTAEPFVHMLRLTFRPAGIGPVMPTHGTLDVRRHRADYLRLLAASDALLLPAVPGLTLIHMPIPHPWGFYDRDTRQFSAHRTSYLDNLALADEYLGHVRQQLEEQGLWDKTAVVITGDHSWRTSFVWAGSAHWTAEEQAASHGGAFDDRPAVIVKLPGQTTGTQLNQPFEAVRTRALLDALLQREITTPEALAHWVATRQGGAR